MIREREREKCEIEKKLCCLYNQNVYSRRGRNEKNKLKYFS